MTQDLADGQSCALHARLSEADVRIDGDAGEGSHGVSLPARVRREHADHAVSDALGLEIGGSLGSLDALGKESPEVRAGGVVRAAYGERHRPQRRTLPSPLRSSPPDPKRPRGGEDSIGHLALLCYGDIVNSALLDRITIESGKCGGRPCIRGSRMRVSDLLELLSHGATIDEIVTDYPALERDDVLAAIAYAAVRLNASPYA